MNDTSEQDDLLIDLDLLPEHRSGFVAVIGKPNVGKSTLMNALLGEKLAIVSPKPQTTRERQLGILTLPNVQVIFVDTPGIHQAHHKLGEYMVEAAVGAIPDADLILFLVDVSEVPTRADEAIADLINEQLEIPVVLAMNKSDLSNPEQIEQHAAAYRMLVPQARSVIFSAASGDKREELLALIVEALPLGPRYYPAEQLTETRLRDSVAEIIREKVLLLYEQEIPHSVAVVVNEFKERSGDLIYISATIFVEKPSQKGILIGKGGEMLKQVGQKARSEMEEVLGAQVFLDLWVKVLRNWRKDKKHLRRLGYRFGQK